jgi:hypothetical protein
MVQYRRGLRDGADGETAGAVRLRASDLGMERMAPLLAPGTGTDSEAQWLTL